MYDELVKRVRQVAEEVCDDYDVDPYNAEQRCLAILQAADAIEELQQIAGHYEESAHDYFKDVCYYLERMPKWIPVTERFPKNGVPTLICGDGNVVEQGFFDDEYGYWYDWGGNRTFVHHWMPLPEPPKEEK